MAFEILKKSPLVVKEHKPLAFTKHGYDMQNVVVRAAEIEDIRNFGVDGIGVKFTIDFTRNAKMFPGKLSKEVSGATFSFWTPYLETIDKRLQAYPGGGYTLSYHGGTIGAKAGTREMMMMHSLLSTLDVADQKLVMDGMKGAYDFWQQRGLDLRERNMDFTVSAVRDKIVGDVGNAAVGAVPVSGAESIPRSYQSWVNGYHLDYTDEKVRGFRELVCKRCVEVKDLRNLLGRVGFPHYEMSIQPRMLETVNDTLQGVARRGMLPALVEEMRKDDPNNSELLSLVYS